MRKAILMAMVAAIVGMFAIPGAASGAWTKHHVNAIENFEREVTGTDLIYEATFNGGSSHAGVTCNQTISKVDFEIGTTGRVTTFEPEGDITSQCQGRGDISQCDVHEAKADNLPWILHTVTPDTVTVTTGTITNTLTGIFCIHTLTLTPGTATMTVGAGETNTTSTAFLSGSFKMDGDLGNELSTTIAGTVHVLGTITYGI